MSVEKVIAALIRAYEEQNNIKVEYKILGTKEENN